MGRSDDDRLDHVLDSDSSNVVGDCAIHSHNSCDIQDCEIRRIHEILTEISTGQVKIAVITALSAVLVASAFGFGLLAIWGYHAFHGNPMPDVPWYIIAIASVPFTAGAMMLKIPQKPKWMIGKPEKWE